MNTQELTGLVQRIAKQNGVDPDIILKIIAAESSNNPEAVSPVGAQGLMQLMPETAAQYGVTDPFDPEQNVNGGTKHFAELLKFYGGDVRKALAAHNWGRGNLDKGGPWPQETQNFVTRVAGPEPSPTPTPFDPSQVDPTPAPIATPIPRQGPTYEQVTSDPSFGKYSPEDQTDILTRLVGPEAAMKHSQATGPMIGPATTPMKPDLPLMPEAGARVLAWLGLNPSGVALPKGPGSINTSKYPIEDTLEETPLNEGDVAQVGRGLLKTAMAGLAPQMLTGMAVESASTPLAIKHILATLGLGAVGAGIGELAGGKVGEATGYPELGKFGGEILGMFGGGALGSAVVPPAPTSNVAGLSQDLAGKVLDAIMSKRMKITAPGPEWEGWGGVPPEVLEALKAKAAERTDLINRGPVRGVVPQPGEVPEPPPSAQRLVKTPQEAAVEGKIMELVQPQPAGPIVPGTAVGGTPVPPTGGAPVMPADQAEAQNVIEMIRSHLAQANNASEPPPPQTPEQQALAAERMKLADRGPVRGVVPVEGAPEETTVTPARPVEPVAEPTRGRVLPVEAVPVEPRTVVTPQEAAARPTNLNLAPSEAPAVTPEVGTGPGRPEAPGQPLTLPADEAASKDFLQMLQRSIASARNADTTTEAPSPENVAPESLAASSASPTEIATSTPPETAPESLAVSNPTATPETTSTVRIGSRDYKVGDLIEEGTYKGKYLTDIDKNGIAGVSKTPPKVVDTSAVPAQNKPVEVRGAGTEFAGEGAEGTNQDLRDLTAAQLKVMRGKMTPERAAEFDKELARSKVTVGEPVKATLGEETPAGAQEIHTDLSLAEGVPAELSMEAKAVIEQLPEAERDIIHRELERARSTDVLTGLQNKKGWIALAKTLGPEDHAVVMDMSGFSEINNTHGHKVGDVLLAVVGQKVQKHLGSDTSRFGGDEFGGVIRGKSLEEAQQMVSALEADLNSTFINIRMPDGNIKRIKPLEVHIGLAKDTEAADLASNDHRAKYGSGRRKSDPNPTPGPADSSGLPSAVEGTEGSTGGGRSGDQGELDSGISKAEVSPGKAVGVTQPRLIRELGANLYSGDLGQVVVKEGLQNAVDAIPRGKAGNISVKVNTKDKTFEITDDGIGMMPDIIKNQFLDPGGTFKPEGGRGGYGIAKVALLSQAEKIEVRSVAEVPKAGEVKKPAGTQKLDMKGWLERRAKGADEDDDFDGAALYEELAKLNWSSNPSSAEVNEKFTEVMQVLAKKGGLDVEDIDDKEWTMYLQEAKSDILGQLKSGTIPKSSVTTREGAFLPFGDWLEEKSTSFDVEHEDHDLAKAHIYHYLAQQKWPEIPTKQALERKIDDALEDAMDQAAQGHFGTISDEMWNDIVENIHNDIAEEVGLRQNTPNVEGDQKVNPYAHMEGSKLETTLSGDGERWLDTENPMDVNTKEVPADTPTGTRVFIKLNDGASVSDWNVRDYLQNFMTKQKLNHKFEVTVDDKPLGPKQVYNRQTQKYEEQAKTSLMNTEKLPGAEVQIWTGKGLHETDYVSVHVLNDGLPQFYMHLNLKGRAKFPSEVEVNVIPKVETTDPNYPFTPNRQQLRDQVKEHVENFVTNRLYSEGVRLEQGLYQKALKNKVPVPYTKVSVMEVTGRIKPETLKEVAESGPIQRVALLTAQIVRRSAATIVKSPIALGKGEDRLKFTPGTFSTDLGYSGGKWYGVNVDTGRVYGKISSETGELTRSGLRQYSIIVDPWSIISIIDRNLPVDEQAEIFGRETWATAVHELMHNKHRQHDEDFSSWITHWLPHTIKEGSALIRSFKKEVQDDPEFFTKLREQHHRLESEFVNAEGEDVLGPVTVESKSRDGQHRGRGLEGGTGGGVPEGSPGSSASGAKGEGEQATPGSASTVEKSLEPSIKRAADFRETGRYDVTYKGETHGIYRDPESKWWYLDGDSNLISHEHYAHRVLGFNKPEAVERVVELVNKKSDSGIAKSEVPPDKPKAELPQGESVKDRINKFLGIKSKEEKPGMSRREFLGKSTVAAAGMALPGGKGLPETAVEVAKSAMPIISEATSVIAAVRTLLSDPAKLLKFGTVDHRNTDILELSNRINRTYDYITGETKPSLEEMLKGIAEQGISIPENLISEVGDARRTLFNADRVVKDWKQASNWVKNLDDLWTIPDTLQKVGAPEELIAAAKKDLIPLAKGVYRQDPAAAMKKALTKVYGGYKAFTRKLDSAQGTPEFKPLKAIYDSLHAFNHNGGTYPYEAWKNTKAYASIAGHSPEGYTENLAALKAKFPALPEPKYAKFPVSDPVRDIVKEFKGAKKEIKTTVKKVQKFLDINTGKPVEGDVQLKKGVFIRQIEQTEQDGPTHELVINGETLNVSRDGSSGISYWKYSPEAAEVLGDPGLSKVKFQNRDAMVRVAENILKNQTAKPKEDFDPWEAYLKGMEHDAETPVLPETPPSKLGDKPKSEKVLKPGVSLKPNEVFDRLLQKFTAPELKSYFGTLTGDAKTSEGEFEKIDAKIHDVFSKDEQEAWQEFLSFPENVSEKGDENLDLYKLFVKYLKKNPASTLRLKSGETPSPKDEGRSLVKDIITGTERQTNLKKWIQGSKVIDKKGEPIEVYHTGQSEKAPTTFKGLAWFSENPKYHDILHGPKSEEGVHMTPAYLNIQNPLHLDSDLDIEAFVLGVKAGVNPKNIKAAVKKGYDLSEDPNSALDREEQFKVIKSLGYDGLQLDEDVPNYTQKGGKVWVAFKPEQIKSSIGNTGKFSSKSKDIRDISSKPDRQGR